MFIDEMTLTIENTDKTYHKRNKTLTIENTDKTYHKRNKGSKKHSPVKVFQ